MVYYVPGMILTDMSDGRDIIEPRDPEISEKSKSHQKVQQYIGRRYEVYLTDGRIIRGTLARTDKNANMVFNQADERWTNPTMPGVRNLGQAMISKKYVTRMIHLREPEIIDLEVFHAALTKAEGTVEINGTGEKTEEKKDKSRGYSILKNVKRDWFFPNISRENTEKLLRGKPDGTYLVRESKNSNGCYALCFSYRREVHSYLVQKTKEGFWIEDGNAFNSLTQLVSHYKRDADGLCHRLVTPIICETDTFSSNGSSSFGSSSTVDLEDCTSVFRHAGLVIPSNDIEVGYTIGHGEFGDVKLGSYKNRKVALKVSKRHGNGTLVPLLDEAKFMVGLSHPNLVTLVGVVLDDINVYMITEYMANGNLIDLMRKRGRYGFNNETLLQWAIEICEGLRYLETRRIIHCSLCAQNIKIDEGLKAKLDNFKLAKKANSQSHDSASGKFPIKWTAPEALRHSQFTTKSDVWSFGILLWEIFSFCGENLYKNVNTKNLLQSIENGLRLPMPRGCPEEIGSIMNQTWSLEPEDRPSFRRVLHKLTAVRNTVKQRNHGV